jgi:hyaluronan synthase
MAQTRLSSKELWFTEGIALEFFSTEWMILCLIVAFLCGLAYYSVVYGVFQPMIHAAQKHNWAKFFIRPSMLWALMGTVMLGFRTLLWFRYRSYKPVDPDEAPFLTVIIPAYNEGAMVGKSVVSVMSAEYPRDRLEVIVIDDGSTERHLGTYERVPPGTGGRDPDPVPEEPGKRAALAEGFRRARGRSSSRSIPTASSKRGPSFSIAGPFRNPGVGAVAGKVAVNNRRSGLIPRMLHVRFVLSFDFLRRSNPPTGRCIAARGPFPPTGSPCVRDVLPAWVDRGSWAWSAPTARTAR